MGSAPIVVVNIGVTSHVGTWNSHGNGNNGNEKLEGEFSPFPPPLEICLLELPILFSILPNIPLAQLSTLSSLCLTPCSKTSPTLTSDLPTLSSSNPLYSLPLYSALLVCTFNSPNPSRTTISLQATPNPPYPLPACACVHSVRELVYGVGMYGICDMAVCGA